MREKGGRRELGVVQNRPHYQKRTQTTHFVTLQREYFENVDF